MKIKKCTGCGKTKPLNAFSKQKISRDMHRTKCKECTKIDNQIYRKENKEKITQWFKDHSEELKKYQKKYRTKNKAKIKKVQHDYHKKNNIKLNIGAKKYRDKHKNEISLYKKDYYQKNRNKILEYQRKLKEKDIFRAWAVPTITNHKRDGYIIKITIEELTAIARKTKTCPFCGIKLNWSLGKKHAKPNSPSWDRIDNGIIMNTKTTQILCQSCNASKSTKTMKQFIEYCTKIANKYKEI